MEFTRKPFHFLLSAGLIFALLPFFALNSQSIDLHLHDTYFVIHSKIVLWIFAIFTFFIWILYRLMNKKLFASSLTWIHIAATLLPLVLCTFVLYFGDPISSSKPLSFYDFSNWKSFDSANSTNKIMRISFLIWLIGQLIFLINITRGLYKAKTE